MKKAAYKITSSTEEILKTMGAQIKSARLMRNLKTELVAERAGISRTSLWKVESGNPSVAIGIYAAVLHALGNMDNELIQICKDDEPGKQLQDVSLLKKTEKEPEPKGAIHVSEREICYVRRTRRKKR